MACARGDMSAAEELVQANGIVAGERVRPVKLAQHPFERLWAGGWMTFCSILTA
jgi:hypothetical protein